MTRSAPTRRSSDLTRALAAAVQQRMPDLRVEHAMRYGKPALAAALARLREAGCERILVLPLYPQFSTTTTTAVADVVARAGDRSEEHTSELQSLMRNSYAVFCVKKNKRQNQ